MPHNPLLGVIGGSGLYGMPDLEDIEEHLMSTPFGEPSSPVFVGTLSGKRVAFIARHGIGHFITPSEVNYRANVYALKSMGVKWVVSVSACGSLRDDYEPGSLVVPDQLFDLTRDRKRSFFEDGLVVHISVAEPFSPQFSQKVFEAAKQTKATVHQGGAFITIEGPRFSTRAESNVYRSWDMSLIGMTASPEAFLAREAEMCYAVLAHVTDYDTWHTSVDPVTSDQVMKIIHQNTEYAQEALRNLVSGMDLEADCEDQNALGSGLITKRELIPRETYEKVSLLIDKYYKDK